MLNKKYSIIVILLLFLFINTASWRPGYSAESLPPIPTSTTDLEIQEIEEVREAALAKLLNYSSKDASKSVLSIELDNIQIAKDSSYATGWILRRDPDTGEIMPTEPGIFVGERSGNGWKIFLPAEQEWIDAVKVLPDQLMSIDEKNRLLSTDVSFNDLTSITADVGYLLPWAEGQTVYLSQSVTHDEYIPSGNAHYAFDFYIPQTMFNLYASKAGTVWAFKDTVPNNDHSDVNFIVLRNADNPGLYQLYLHLAQNSIPPSLKSIGAQVIQGQFVGVADNTGASTGHHLHFQVQTQPYWPLDNPYWGVSVDIKFNEVGIYGGRPRVSYEYDEEICGGYCVDGLRTYVSANTLKGDLVPPIGNFTGVTMGQLVKTRTLNISGWASDADSGLYSGQLRALYDGAWHYLGNQFGSTFSYEWDLCSSDEPIPDGVVSVGMRLYDWDGNWAEYAGLRHFIKDYACPNIVPSCTPSNDQVILYEDVDFSGGCVVFNPGNYPDAAALGTLGNDDAASIKVGSNVQATLYSEENFHGHSETFVAADSNLVDNLIRNDTLSSLKIGSRMGIPGVPEILSPISGLVVSTNDQIPLSWENGNNSIEYQVRYTLAGGSTTNLSWQKNPFLYLGPLATGGYTWQVRGKNQQDVTSSWSQSGAFEVESTPALPPIVNAPFIDDMESDGEDWIRTGLWTLKDDEEMSLSGTYSWWYQGSDSDYDTGMPNYGSLTSPRIFIPSDDYYLRFWYRYATETNGHLWDQRWLQVSIDGSPFENLYQLQDDPQIAETTSWILSKAINLNEYAGHTVRFRFQFATFDSSMNSYRGWGIDDFSVTATAPPTCDDNRMDDTVENAYELILNESESIQAEICPGGDYDFYKFYGFNGDRIVIDINAQTIDSPLDSYLVLIDSDGVAVLAEHDDEVYAERRDPLLAYTLPHDGIYYIKVRAWKHPTVGGDDQEYVIRLYKDNIKPSVNILVPLSNSYIQTTPFEITALVFDVADGVSHVDFYWHDYDWVLPTWEYLGTDWDPADGWTMNFDPAGLIEKNGGAFYLDAYDKAGNLTSTGIWNIGVDLTPPSTDLQPLESVQESTAILLSWSGSDQGSGLAHANLQFIVNGGIWQNYTENLDGFQSWFVGSPANGYNFRIRGVDNAGNIESYPLDPQANTSIPSADVLCSSPDQFESGEGDNSAILATQINTAGGIQIHNYCNVQSPDRLNDEDWVKFDVRKDIRYHIQAIPLLGNAGTILELYASDGMTLIKSVASSAFGNSANIYWTSDRDDEVFLRMRHLDGRVIGNQVSYEILVNEGFRMYLPISSK